MNILFVCHRFPFPPKRGGKIRPFNIIRHLSAEHEVHVVSLAHSDEDEREAPGISSHCASFSVHRPSKTVRWARMLARVPTTAPSAPGYFVSGSMQRAVDEVLSRKSIDLIVVHCAFVAHNVANVKGIPKVLDFGDMDSQKWLAYSAARPFPLSAVYALEGRKMERAEAKLAACFDLCTATTRLELETLRLMGTAHASDWFPNGVDAKRFAPMDIPDSYDPNLVVFVGRMDYFPNQRAAERFACEVMPLLRKHRPLVEFRIVGAEPTTAILMLGDLPGVTVTGTVPDVRDHVRGAALTVAPLDIARGTQNKMLESMAMGVPVVASPDAAKGVDAVIGEHLLVANSVDDTADRVLEILDDPVLRERLSTAGRARMLDHHDWTASLDRFDSIVGEHLGINLSKAAAEDKIK